MDDKATLSALIGDIYDAALDPALWTDVLVSITEFVGRPALERLREQIGQRLLSRWRRSPLHTDLCRDLADREHAGSRSL
jgi:hypothetical protein